MAARGSPFGVATSAASGSLLLFGGRPRGSSFVRKTHSRDATEHIAHGCAPSHRILRCLHASHALTMRLSELVFGIAFVFYRREPLRPQLRRAVLDPRRLIPRPRPRCASAQVLRLVTRRPSALVLRRTLAVTCQECPRAQVLIDRWLTRSDFARRAAQLPCSW